MHCCRFGVVGHTEAFKTLSASFISYFLYVFLLACRWCRRSWYACMRCCRMTGTGPARRRRRRQRRARRRRAAGAPRVRRRVRPGTCSAPTTPSCSPSSRTSFRPRCCRRAWPLLSSLLLEPAVASAPAGAQGFWALYSALPALGVSCTACDNCAAGHVHAPLLQRSCTEQPRNRSIVCFQTPCQNCGSV